MSNPRHTRRLKLSQHEVGKNSRYDLRFSVIVGADVTLALMMDTVTLLKIYWMRFFLDYRFWFLIGKYYLLTKRFFINVIPSRVEKPF